MRQYLESTVVQQKALQFLTHNTVVGAICHGALVLARTIDPTTGRSVLYGRRLTGLTKRLERAGYYLTAWRLGDYYRTYPAYVEDETVHVLNSPFNIPPWEGAKQTTYQPCLAGSPLQLYVSHGASLSSSCLLLSASEYTA